MKELYKLISLVALLLCLSLPSQAVTQLIKQNATDKIEFLLVDAASGQTGQTGLAGSVVIKVSKASGTGAASAGTVAEKDATNFPGVYIYTPTSGETNTVGILGLHVSCAGCQTQDYAVQVYDPAQFAPTVVQVRQEMDANSTQFAAHTVVLNKFGFTGGNVNSAAQNLPSVYPLAANDELLLGYLFNMVDANGGVPRYRATSLALAPTGAGSASVDPFSLPRTGQTYGTGTWGNYFSGLPQPADIISYLFAQPRFQRIEANDVGSYVRNPATGVITLTRQDGVSMTITTTVDGQGRITGRTVSP